MIEATFEFLESVSEAVAVDAAISMAAQPQPATSTGTRSTARSSRASAARGCASIADRSPRRSGPRFAIGIIGAGRCRTSAIRGRGC